MKMSAVVALGSVVVLSVSALVQVSPPASRPLSNLLPGGALLVVEAQDFSALVQDWDRSPEKQLWLESDNYQAFSRTRLFLRLRERQEEFAAAAGFPPDMGLLRAMAGRESALGLYDIGNLEFLYVTRMPMARTMESVLWRMRGEYESRESAGRTYFVRVDPESHRVVAFAVTDDHLLVATREELLAAGLALLVGQPGSRVNDERWYEQVVRLAGQPGEVRLVMNLEAIVRTPYFRSYWVQRNVSGLRPYAAGVSDLYRSKEEIREERVFLRSRADSNGEPPGRDEDERTAETALAEVLRLVPEDYGFYRGWAKPSVEETLGLLERKLLAPRGGMEAASRQAAPEVRLRRGTVGSVADLETRIDEEPPRMVSAGFAPAELRSLLESAQPRAILQVQSSRTLPGEVFVKQDSALVVLASTDWDARAARSALLASIEGLWTTSRLGARWGERRRGANPYYELDGLVPLAMAVRGPLLIVADRPELLLAVLAKLDGSPLPAASDEAIYAAAFRHAREGDYFLRMMRLLDYPWVRNYGRAEEREPRFFSENLGSLSRVLRRVEQASIVVQDRGSWVAQTIVYRLTR
ncbi:MAG: hypothetical protein ACE5G6_00205 [Terriglobia bacterium]